MSAPEGRQCSAGLPVFPRRALSQRPWRNLRCFRRARRIPRNFWQAPRSQGFPIESPKQCLDSAAPGACMPLSSTTMITGILYCTAVANSCPFIRKSPSPQATLDLASIPERIQTEVQRAIQHSIKGVEYFSTSGPALGSTPKDMLHSRGTMQRTTDSPPPDDATPTRCKVCSSRVICKTSRLPSSPT